MNKNTSTIQLEIDNIRLQNFAESFSQSNIFHHPKWIQLLADCYGYKPRLMALSNNEDQLLAYLPLMEVKAIPTGKRWISLPFSDYSIPLFNNVQSLEELTQSLERMKQSLKVSRIEIRWELTGSSSFQPGSEFFLHRLHLEKDPEVVLKKLHRTQRQNIHIAEKSGVEIKRGTNMETMREFYHLHCLTRHRQGVPVQPWRFFKIMQEQILEKNLGFILLARAQDETLAAGLFLHWGKTLTYKYASSIEKLQNLRPNHLLTWTAIRWGCENGFSIFDFGRTDKTNDGLRTYKTRWGVEETELTYSIFSNNKEEHKQKNLISVMENIIKKSPLWFCRLSGEILYRYFG